MNMVNLNFNQLHKVMDEEKKDMADAARRAQVEAMMKEIHSQKEVENKKIKWEYATFYWPRSSFAGPEPEEKEQLVAVGEDSWEMIGFQIYPIDHSARTHMAEYIFKRMIE